MLWTPGQFHVRGRIFSNDRVCQRPIRIARYDEASRSAPTLVVIKASSLATELLAQYAVFFLQVVDHVALMLVQAAGERNQQQPKRSGIRIVTA